MVNKLIFRHSKHYFTLIIMCLIGLGSAQADITKTYQKLCGTCHGNQGDGKGRAGANLVPRPTDFRESKLSAAQMLDVLANGRAGTSMVGYGRRLSQAEMQAMVSFIRASFMADTRSVASVSGAVAKENNTPGQSLYDQHCAACHGDRGNTAVWARGGLNPPPRNFTSEASRRELSRERMILSVTHGRPGTAMMSFKKRLQPQEIETVVDFVRTSFMQVKQAKQKPASVDVVESKSGSAAYPGKLKADPDAGRLFYQRNCFSCHGRKGKGDGPRAHFNHPRPRDFTTIESRRMFDRTRLFSSIKQGKQGTVMPAWGKVLGDKEIADVAEYVYQNFIQSPKKKSPLVPQ